MSALSAQVYPVSGQTEGKRKTFFEWTSIDIWAAEMDFKVGGREGGGVLSATMVRRQEKFSNSRRSRMPKAVIF